jgi:hypothetical protein
MRDFAGTMDSTEIKSTMDCAGAKKSTKITNNAKNHDSTMDSTKEGKWDIVSNEMPIMALTKTISTNKCASARGTRINSVRDFAVRHK